MKNWFYALGALAIAGALAFWVFHTHSRNEMQSAEPAARYTATSQNSAGAPPRIEGSSRQPAQTASRNSEPAPSITVGASITATASASSAVSLPRASVSSAPPAGEAPPLLPPETLLENMRTAIRQYGLRFGGNPVGNNAEITKALNGDNSKQVNFLGPDGNRINEKGELVDAWGTPYFFHQLSAMEMEIRSAGPDKTMWTGDDLVIK